MNPLEKNRKQNLKKLAVLKKLFQAIIVYVFIIGFFNCDLIGKPYNHNYAKKPPSPPPYYILFI